MSTKQQRLSDSALIKSRVVSLVGKSISVVLRDNTVQTGLIESLTDGGIVLRNMRLKKTEYAFSQIAEIYFDTTA